MRRDLDFYETPAWVSAWLFDRLGGMDLDVKGILDPACGRGAILDEAKNFGWQHRAGFELDASRGVQCAAKGHATFHLDSLASTMQVVDHAVVMNPPFSHCFEFVKKYVAETKHVFALLRLGFLASKKRREWLENNPPNGLIILSSRPSFTEDGKTDSQEYAWFCWSPATKKPLDWIGRD